MRKDVRAFIRRLEPAGITVEPKPRHYRVLRDDKPLRKANGMPFMLPFSPHLILISKRLRPEARATVEYFRREGVALKVILGHRPDTSLRSHPPRASRRAHRRTGGVLPDDPAELALPLPLRRSSASGARAAWRLLVSLKKTGCEQARER
jgi:hypothetical protein